MIDENQKIELFDKFYTWLKEDGLKPKTSERLHRKKIFASLLANDEMTLENFKDFLKDEIKNEIRDFVGKTFMYKNKSYIVNNVKIEKKEFFIIGENLKMKCTYEQLDEIRKIIKEKNE